MKLFNNKVISVLSKTISGLLIFIFVLSYASFVFMPAQAEAAFNKQINYQGKLTNSSNIAVADGTYQMMFRLYTTATGGSPIWTEDRSTALGDRVTVSNGLFSVMLGSSTPLTTVDFNQTLYLGVEVQADGEMTPRKILGAVPAAFTSDTVDGISSEQFLRSDASNATSTTGTFLSFVQNGAGKIAEFFGPAAASVLSILSGGNVGIGTTTPYAKLSVAGRGVFNQDVRADYFTATSTTLASTFTYASTTALTVSGTNGLTLGTLNGPLQAINGAVSATSTLSIAYGGTGLSTGPSYGQILVGNAAGGYTLTATSSLGITSSQWTTSGNNIYNSNTGNVGVGTSTPYSKLSVWGTDTASTTIAEFTNSASTTVFSVTGNGQLNLNGTASAPNFRIYNNGTDTILGGIAQNGGNTIITANPNVTDSQAGRVFIYGATGVGEAPVLSGGVYIGDTVVSMPTGISTPATNFLGVGGQMTVNGYAQFNSDIFVGTPGGITAGVANIALAGQGAKSIGMERAMNLVSAGQAFTINAGGAKSGTTNQNGGNLTLRPGVSTGNGVSTLTLGAYGGGTSGTSDRAMTNALVLAYNQATFGSGMNVAISTSTPWGRLSVGTHDLAVTTPSFVIASSSTGVATTTQFIVTNGFVGIGTSTPYAKLSVDGRGVFNQDVRADYFTATSTTLASTFTYASTTALTVSGTNGLTLGTLNGPLQAINGAVSATSTLSIAYGGTGLSTGPSYGQILVGNAAGGYTLTATSSLGITSSQWTTNGSNIYYNTGNVGIGTTSPYAKLSVDGQGVFNQDVRADYFTATSTTIASTFPYASTTALTVAGTNGLTLGTLNGPLQAINGAVSATSTLSISYGGTGLSTAPANGQILLGNSSGGYSLVATSSLGITSSQWTTSGSNIYNSNSGNVGIGTSTPYSKLSVWGTDTASTTIAEFVNSASTTIFSVTANGQLNLKGTAALPNFRIYNNGTDSYLNGLALNGGGTYISGNPNIDSAQAGSVFLYGALGTGEAPVLSGGVYVGTSTVSRPVGVLDTASQNFLGVGGYLTVGDYAEFRNNIFVGGLSAAGTAQGVSTISLQGQAARSIGVERNFTAATAGQALTINAGGAKSAGTNLNGGSLTLRSGVPTGTGTSGITLGVYGGGTSGTSDRAITNALVLAYNQATFASGMNVAIGTSTPWGRLSIGTHDLAITSPSFVIASSSTGVATTTQFIVTNGFVGIGTSTPYAKLSVDGQGVFNQDVRANYFTATSTTLASTFTYASTTALTVSGVNGLSLGSLNGPLQAINGAVSATSTLSISYGGTGLSTAPAYGQLLVGNAAAGYTLTATSSLGITSSQWTTSGANVYYNTGNVGVGTTSPFAKLAVSTTAQQDGGLPLFTVASTTFSTLFTVLGNGNVGIGTTSPLASLDVVSQTTQNTGLTLTGNINGFYQGNIKNLNSGSSASSDWVATANNGSDTTHYIDMGINGSGGGAAPFTTANQAYLYSVDDTLNIGALGSAAEIALYTTGGTSAPAERARITAAGLFGIGTSTPYSKFTVWGSGTGTGQLANFVNNASTSVMTLLDNGTVTIGTSSGGTVTIGASSGSDLVLNDAQWSVTGAGSASFASGTFTAASAPTTDIVRITNAGQGVTSTSGVDGLSINYVQATNGTAITGSAIDVSLTPSNDSSDVIRGITLNSFTPGASTETGLYIGTGYDREIEFASSTPTIVLGGTDNTSVFKIVDSNATPQKLFELRDYSTNVGGLVSTGGFLGTMSYMSEEFNDDTTASNGADSAVLVGDYSASSGGQWYFDQSATGPTFAQGDNIGGFIRVSTGTTANTSATVGFGFGQNNLALNYAMANLPVLQMKLRTSSTANTNDVIWGFTTSATIGTTNDNLPTDGIFFWPNNGTSWVGVVRASGSNVGTVTCPGSISTTQFAVGRIQVESATLVRFLMDNDASDGVQLTDCGTVSGAGPSVSLGIAMAVVQTSTSNANIDLDYVRAWQDDAADASATAGSQPIPAPVATPFTPKTDLQNLMTRLSNHEINDVCNQVECVDLQVLTLSKGLIAPSVTVNGLTVDGITALKDLITVNSDISFIGRPYFMTDTAGFALIKAGNKRVDVRFEKSYLEQPIVTAGISINGTTNSSDGESLANQIFTKDVRYIVTNKTQNGFSIILNKEFTNDLTFSWVALAVKGAKTFESTGPGLVQGVGTTVLVSGGAGTTTVQQTGGSGSSSVDSTTGNAEQNQSNNGTLPSDGGNQDGGGGGVSAAPPEISGAPAANAVEPNISVTQ